MAMHKSLFDLSIEETTSTEMPHTVKFSNETGTGSMIICPLFWVQSCIITICTLHSLRKPRHQCGMSLRSTTAAWGVTSAVLGQIAAAIWQQGILRCVQRRAKVVLLLSAAALPRHHHPTGSGCDFAGNVETNGMVRRRP